MSGRAARASRREKLRAQYPSRQFGPAQVKVRTIRPLYPVQFYDPIQYHVEPRAYERVRRIFENICTTSLFNRREVMNVPVVYEDETENEFDVELCCAECSAKTYGWSSGQFSKVSDSIKNGIAIKIPDHVDSENKFKDFVKTL